MDVRFDAEKSVPLTEEEVRRQVELTLGRYSAEIIAVAVELKPVPPHPASRGGAVTVCRIDAELGTEERPRIEVSSRDRDERGALLLALARCERTIARRFDVAKLLRGSRLLNGSR